MVAPGIEIDEARLATICGNYGIGELQIFGSGARGTMQNDSDIDILYTLRPGTGSAGKSTSSPTN